MENIFANNLSVSRKPCHCTIPPLRKQHLSESRTIYVSAFSSPEFARKHATKLVARLDCFGQALGRTSNATASRSRRDTDNVTFTGILPRGGHEIARRRIALCVGEAGADDVALHAPLSPTISELKERAASLGAGLKGTSIFLVGMMGSGKSSVGKLLADLLGYYFFDSDAVVEAAAGGVPVAQIFAEQGEEAFRDAETQVLAELSSLGRLVVATGGGAVLRPTNWSYLHNGVCVYLEAPVPVLASRVVSAGTHSRPLLASAVADSGTAGQEGAAAGGDHFEEVVARLTTILETRSGLYSNADTTVSFSSIMAEDQLNDPQDVTVERIIHQIFIQIEELMEEKRQKDRALRAQSELHQS